ncbi:MAG: hypothetical protein CL916_10810 [Deltaproteobacteria bacterium]|nr:hypothetical protein [Deltaproteobacteria bacterium]
MLGPKPIRPIHHYVLPGLFVLSLFVALIVRSPKQHRQQNLQGEIMGTYWIVKTIHGDSDLQDAIQAELDAINAKMSTYLPQSELSLFNTHQETTPFSFSNETIEVIQAAQKVSEHSNGAFDVTIKPLVDLWGFGTNKSTTPPSEQYRTAAMKKVGYTSLTINAKTIQKKNPQMEIDLSAIAKGYAVDQIAQLLDQKGHANYMVDIGGEIKAKGKNSKDQYWRIGIETPDTQRGAYTDIIELQDMAIATSGDYRNYYEQDGKRISHTIDARTGMPITHTLASVSVLHPSAMMADGWATALNVVGPQEAITLAQKHNLNIMLIVRNKKNEHEIQYSNQFTQYRIIDTQKQE